MPPDPFSQDPLDYLAPSPEALKEKQDSLSCSLLIAGVVGFFCVMSVFALFSTSLLLGLLLLFGLTLLITAAYFAVTALGWSAATAITLTAFAAFILMLGLCSQLLVHPIHSHHVTTAPATATASPFLHAATHPSTTLPTR